MLLNALRGLCDRVILVACIVAGGTLPGFVNQYQQRLAGRLEQVQADLAPFQAIADRFHGGSLEALIAHHAASTDPSFRAEADALRAMATALQGYLAEMQALQGGLWARIAHVATAADASVLAATWSSFSPTFALTPDALLVALTAGLVVWSLFIAAWFGCGRLAGRLRRRGTGAPAGHATPRDEEPGRPPPP